MPIDSHIPKQLAAERLRALRIDLENEVRCHLVFYCLLYDICVCLELDVGQAQAVVGPAWFAIEAPIEIGGGEE